VNDIDINQIGTTRHLLGEGPEEDNAGSLFAVQGLGVKGVEEPRYVG